MHLKDTPPSSPNMEAEDLFEEEVEVLSDVEVIESDEDNDEEEAQPIRDDATCVFSNHTGSVFCCHVEPQASRLAVTGGEDDMAYVWNTQSGEVVLRCTGHKDSVTCVAFSYDGSFVATGDMSGVVQVWKMSSKSLVWESNVGDLEWLRWHHGANVLLGGAISGDVYMWRIPAGDCKVLPGSSKKTECGLILPDGKRAAVGYEDGAVRIFDLKTATQQHHVEAHGDALTDMDCHSDNNLLITSSVDGRAVVTKTQSGKVVTVLNCSENREQACSVEAVKLYDDCSLPLAATGTLDGVLSIWDISKGVQRHQVKQEAGITKLLWSRASPLVFTAGLDGSISLYDARSGTLHSQLLGHSNGILDICLAKDGRSLLSTSYDSTARVFPVNTQ